MAVRQPIVSVLGHVDHGKTSLLDYIRGSSVASREAGLITQHIGATEVPIDTIAEICGPLFDSGKVRTPGLLFIDTPGHRAFTSLRARGGSLADLAIVVVDIIEGLMPQTIESIEILKRHRTPFVIAANKVDRISGWTSRPRPFGKALEAQQEHVREDLEKRLFALIGDLHRHGVNADRVDRIQDFTRNFAIVPVSAKTGEGVPDLLLLLIGLAQRFLGDRIAEEGGPGEGTVLEVKEELGLGTTIDVILYRGALARGDAIAIGGLDRAIVTKVKAILKPKPLDEIRDPRDQFTQVDEVSAAAGVKVLSQDLGDVVPGSPIVVITGEDVPDLACVSTFEEDPEGIIIKADTLGSLEAMQFECREAGIRLRKACIGPVSRSDVMEASAVADPRRRVILAFNVRTTPDAQEAADEASVTLITGDVIFHILERYVEWNGDVCREMDEESRERLAYPASIRLLPDHVFRLSKPAIVGVRVLTGRVRPGLDLIRDDGKPAGTIRSIRSGEESLRKAIAGQEVALALEGVTVGRQIREEDLLYVDIPESHVKALRCLDISYDEKEVLDATIAIKRKENPYWGM